MWEIWVHCWFLMALPLSVTVTVSFLILRQIKNSEQNHGGKKNMNMQITRMILKTVTFFVIRIAVQCIVSSSGFCGMYLHFDDQSSMLHIKH